MPTPEAGSRSTDGAAADPLRAPAMPPLAAAPALWRRRAWLRLGGWAAAAGLVQAGVREPAAAVAAAGNAGPPADFEPWMMTFRRQRDGRAVEGRLMRIRGHVAEVRVGGRLHRLDARELAADSRQRLDFLQVRGRVERLALPAQQADEVTALGLHCLRYLREEHGDGGGRDDAGGGLPFLLHEPADAGVGGREFPLVMFLHGNGGRGRDGYMNFADGGKAPSEFLGREFQQWLTSYVYIPQSAESTLWSNTSIFRPREALLRAVQCIDLLKARHGLPIDMRRLYVTGLSSGGTGCYEAVAKFPGKFAAAVPIACNHDPVVFYRENTAPVWLFVNRGDRSVDFNRVEELAAHFRRLGAEHRVTLLPGGGHNAWSAVYGNMDFRRWLGRQQLGVLRYPTEPGAWIDADNEARERPEPPPWRG